MRAEKAQEAPSRRGPWPGLGALWLLSSGCPFVFSPPDLSNVDMAPTDGATDGQSDTGPYDVPVVLSLSGRRGLDYLRLEIALEDADLDLVGGTIELTSSAGEEVSLRIPDDISNWRADGVSFLDLPMPFLSCEEGYNVAWTAHAVDAAGHAGLPQATTVEVTGLGLFPESDFAHDAGYIEGTVAACVQFDFDPSRPAVLLQLQNDLEGTNFRPLNSGMYTITMGWPSSMDVDVYLYQATAPYGYVASSESPGDAREILALELQAGQYLQVAPFFTDINGSPPPYIATILWQQE